MKNMSRGLCNSITVLLKIKMKDKMKVALTFLSKVQLKKILACFVLKVPFLVQFFSFVLFIFAFYFIFIYYFRLYLKHFSFIFAAFKKRIICEFACEFAEKACWVKQFWLHGLPLAELHNTSRTNAITFPKLHMSIPVPNFNMLWKELFLFKFVGLGIFQYFMKVQRKTFQLMPHGLNLLILAPLLLFFNAGDASECG